MKTIKLSIFFNLIFIPVELVYADTACRVNETPQQYEIVCTGDPVSKPEQSQVDVIPRVQGKHRPSPRFMEEGKSSRLKQINEHRLQGEDVSLGEPLLNIDSSKGK
jgi:hypothetical protein